MICLRTFLAAAALTAAVTVPASAQISFSSAIDLALRNNPRVLAAEAEVDKARAGLEQARDIYIPTLVGGSGLGYSYGFPLGQPSVFNFTSQSLLLSFSQPDYIRAARASLTAANLALKDRFGTFIVRQGNPGLVGMTRYKKMGWRGYHLNGFTLEDCFVPDDDVLGAPNAGFLGMMSSINQDRLLSASRSLGLASRAQAMACEYANERKVFNNVPIGSYQGLQHPLASARTDIEMASLMTLKAAWVFDQGREAGEFSNMAKLAAADAGTKAVDTALQCFGGNGFTKEYGIFDIYPMVRLLKTAPLNREMLLNYIGERVMGLPRSY